MDKRGREMWGRVMHLLAEAEPDGPDLGRPAEWGGSLRRAGPCLIPRTGTGLPGTGATPA